MTNHQSFRCGTRVGAILLAAVFSAGLAGCGKSASNQVDTQAVLGTWTEVPKSEAETTGRFGGGAEPGAKVTKLRKLVMNQDGTFLMTFVNDKGAPAGDAKVSGTWKGGKAMLEFEVTNSTLAGDAANSVPASGRTVKFEDKPLQFVVFDQNGQRITFTTTN
jgi:hypothetical protein